MKYFAIILTLLSCSFSNGYSSDFFAEEQLPMNGHIDCGEIKLEFHPDHLPMVERKDGTYRLPKFVISKYLNFEEAVAHAKKDKYITAISFIKIFYDETMEITAPSGNFLREFMPSEVYFFYGEPKLIDCSGSKTINIFTYTINREEQE